MGFEGLAKEGEGARVWGGDFGFEFPNGAEPDLGAVGQIFLRPFEKAARGAALGGCQHRAI